MCLVAHELNTKPERNWNPTIYEVSVGSWTPPPCIFFHLPTPSIVVNVFLQLKKHL